MIGQDVGNTAQFPYPESSFPRGMILVVKRIRAVPYARKNKARNLVAYTRRLDRRQINGPG